DHQFQQDSNGIFSLATRSNGIVVEISRISLIDPVSDPRPATSQLHRDLNPAHPRSAAPAAAPAPACNQLRSSTQQQQQQQNVRFLFTGALSSLSSLFPALD